MNTVSVASESKAGPIPRRKLADVEVQIELTHCESVGAGINASLASLNDHLERFDWPEYAFVQLHALKAHLTSCKGLVGNICNQSAGLVERSNRENRKKQLKLMD